MSTLTRTNSHTKKPQYKDYVSFLDNYRTGKKDDQSSVNSDSGVNFSLTNSSNNSSNSVFSDVSDATSRNGFKEHIEIFNNTRNAPVNSDLSKSNQKQQTVKSEVFIEIKNPSVSKNYTTKVFEVQNIDKPQEATISVSRATKIFEKDGQTGTNSLQSKPSFSKQSSIGEISKKFEGSSKTQKTNRTPPKRAASIGEVSKIFENKNSNQDAVRKQKNFNRVPRPFQAATLPKLTTEVKVTPVSSKPLISPKPVFAAPPFPKFTQESYGHQDNADSAFSSLSVSPSPPQSVSPPPVSFSTASSGTSSPFPPPPPLPPSNFASKSTLSGFVKTASSQNVIPPPLSFSAPSSGPTIPPPPPPPLPPTNVTTKSTSNGFSSLSQNGSAKFNQNGSTSPQPVRNGAVNQKITVQTNEVPPQQNTGSINRNDPRFKKAVYGALRNMYGAYHDQANDYLATLPKNRVKKNNGLDEIINSIASQGGLEKLNGRANPGQDVE